MMEYRKVVQFFYKGNSYNLYLDNKNRHYFLKNDVNGNLQYITIEELVDLVCQFTSIPLVMNIKQDNSKNKVKIVPKIIIGGVAVVLSASILSLALSMYQSQQRIKKIEQNKNNTTQIVENYISYNDVAKKTDVDDELIIDTYLESDLLNYLNIYDMEYLDKALDYKEVTINQIKEVISNNNQITDKFKNLMYDYCNSIIEKYPNIELRVLYENLKTLEIVECDKNALVEKTLSFDSYGCYVSTENKIYVLNDCEYKKGTWAYQVIFHEISHCLRTGYWNKNGTKIRVQVEGLNFYNTITAEALNSLFSVSLFDYNEKDIAYQLQSNYHGIMIECMDNYFLEDYVNHSLSYYAKKLDEFNNDDNYSTVILNLIQMQYDDFHSEAINVAPEGYYPIYDYISNMYYRKYINSNMNYSEAVEVADRLIERVMFDVPEDYNIDVDYFYDYLNEYCNSIGINTNVKIK